jgi:hypothetical protein
MSDLEPVFVVIYALPKRLAELSYTLRSLEYHETD